MFIYEQLQNNVGNDIRSLKQFPLHVRKKGFAAVKMEKPDIMTDYISDTF